VSCFFLRVPSALGRAETHPAFATATAVFKQVAASFSIADGMLGAGQRESKDQKPTY
jgi:hypothetical protein